MPDLQTYKGVYLWNYVPNLPAAVTFASLFGHVTLAHGWKMVTTRMWFCLPFVIGGIFEEIGYIARAAAYNATGSLILYILQAIFLVLPPILFSASLYMVYSRVVRAAQGEAFSPMTPRKTTILFITGDFLCLSVQGNGSGLLVNPNLVHIGNYIIVGGLVIQVLMFAGFLWCCISFNRRFRAHVAGSGARVDVPWQACLNMLYATSMAILVRNVYRVAEFVMGQDGYLMKNEWTTYVFDGALMLLVMVGFWVWYPSQLKLKATGEMIELRSDAAGSAGRERTARDSKQAV